MNADYSFRNMVVKTTTPLCNRPSGTDPVDYFLLPSGNLVSPVHSENFDLLGYFYASPVTMRFDVYIQTNKIIKIQQRLLKKVEIYGGP